MYSKKYTTLITLTIICVSFAFPRSVSAQALPDGSLSFKDKKSQEGYILNLKALVKKSKKKIEHVNEKLKDQAKLSRNKRREEKAREYYEKAMRHFNENKFEEAQSLWKKAIQITEHQEMKGYMRESVRKTKKQDAALRKEEDRRLKQLEIERGFSAKEVEKAYQIGVTLFKQKKYIESKNEFERVEDMFPDHKATRSYIMVINQEIDLEQQELIEKKLKEEAVVRKKEKEQWRRGLEKKEKDRERNIVEQAEAMYGEAFKLYKTRQFVKAKEKFKEVEWLFPNYKSTLKYLAGIDYDIAKKEQRSDQEKHEAYARQLKEEKLVQEKEAERLMRKRKADKKAEMRRKKDEAKFAYRGAVSLYNNQLYTQAKERFYEVEKIIPKYKKTEKYLKNIAKKLNEEYVPSKLIVQKFEAQEDQPRVVRTMQKSKADDSDLVKAAIAKRQRMFESESEEKYRDAIAFYKANEFIEAKIKFIQVEALSPNYKDTLKYLTQIDDDIDTGSRRKKLGKKSQVKKKPKKKGKVSISKKKSSRSKKDGESPESEIYDEAVRYYKAKQYVKAQEKFNDVNQLAFGYKSTNRYLKKIRKRYRKEKAKAAKKVKTYKTPEDISKKYTKMGKYEWEEESEKWAAKIKAKEEHLEKLHSKEYKKFKDEIEAEKRAMEKVKKQRNRRAKNRKKEAKRQLAREDKEKTLAEEKAVQDRLAQEREGNEQIQKQEMADLKQKIKDDELALKKQIKAEKQMGKNVRKSLAKLKEQQKEIERQAQEIAKKVDDQADVQARLAKLKEQQEEIERQAQEIAKKIDDQEGGAQERLTRFKKQQGEIESQVEEIAKKIADQKDEIEINEKLKRERENQQAKAEEKRQRLEAERLARIHREKQEKDKSLEAYEYSELKKEKEEAEVNKEREEIRANVGVAKKMRKLSKLQEEQKKIIDRESRKIKKELAKLKAEEEKNFNKKVVEKIYQEALRLYREDKDYEMARLKFLSVEGMSPGYKSAKAYAKGLNRKIQKEEVQLREKFRDEFVDELEIEEKEVIDSGREASIRESERPKERPKTEKELKATKRTVERLYREALELYRGNKLALAKKKFEKFESLLARGDFSDAYRKKMRKRLNKDRKRIEKKLEREQKKKIEIVKRRKGELKRSQIRSEEQKKRELLRLEDKVRREEKEIAREKEKRGYLSQQDVFQEKSQPEADWSGLSEKEKRRELEKLVKQRQKELREERTRIQRQFDENLEQLYSKAVSLHGHGEVNQAREIFIAIENLRPNYKKTKAYLAKVQKQIFKNLRNNERVNQAEISVTSRAKPKTRQDLIADALDFIEVRR